MPSKDPAALAAAIVDLLSDPGRASTLAVAARGRMMSKFRLATMVEGTLDVYREIGLA